MSLEAAQPPWCGTCVPRGLQDLVAASLSVVGRSPLPTLGCGTWCGTDYDDERRKRAGSLGAREREEVDISAKRCNLLMSDTISILHVSVLLSFFLRMYIVCAVTLGGTPRWTFCVSLSCIL